MGKTSAVSIEYPDELLVSLKYSKDEFTDEIKKMSLIKLYELGRISSGLAAKALGISRVEFLDILGKHKVSIFSYDTKDELMSDLKNA